MFGKIFGKKKQEAQAKLSKIENRDLMEAIVGGSILVAAADGEIEPEELQALEKLLATNDNLKHFGAEIGKEIAKFESMFDAGFRMGKMKVMREIEDVKNNPEEAEEVFVMMLTIAEADGEIEPEELVILKEVGQKIGIRLSDFGIE